MLRYLGVSDSYLLNVQPTEPPVPLPAGKGIPLGHISNVEVALSRFKTQDQKLLHQYLYGVSNSLIKEFVL